MAVRESQVHGIVVSHDVMVPMRDGIRLATDIYRPADMEGSPLQGEFPVILGRTSYDKSNPVIWVDPVANAFVPRGYVVLLQDLRGRGRSEGTGDYFQICEVEADLKGLGIIFTLLIRRKAWTGMTRSSGRQLRTGVVGG